MIPLSRYYFTQHLNCCPVHKEKDMSIGKGIGVVTPAALEPHQADYQPRAWEQYTFAELGDWVHLLTTRAGHRVQGPKRNKDLMDAKNYLEMMRAKLDVLLQAENLPA